MKKGVLLIGALLIVSLSVSVVFANYINGDIYISESGKAFFNVNTDIPVNITGLEYNNGIVSGTTDDLCNLEKGTFEFSINLSNYSVIFLDIYFPKGTYAISSNEGVNSIINLNDKKISLIDYDKNLYFRVKYKTNEAGDRSFFWIFLGILIGLSIVIGFMFYKKVKKQKERINLIMPIINDNEKNIINLLMKRPMRQKEIRKSLNIPKASFSRYMINLEKKKLIERNGLGKNKLVRLK